MVFHMSAYSQQNSNIRNTWILIFLFVSGISALCYLMGVVTDQPWIAVVGFIISIGQALVGYFAGDKIALSTVRAEEITEQQAPQIHELVYNLAKISGIPKPKIYISPDRSANAFATGRNPQNASICLNQGILDLLSKPELEGVIAHELSHVKNRDTLIMTVTMVLASVASFIADIGFRVFLFGRNDRDNQSPILLIAYIIAIISAPILATLIQLAISRQREYLADASAVTMTRYPNGLIGALSKLYESPVPADNYATSMNHFYISPSKKEFGEQVAGLFSTHPPLEDRIEALKKMN
jgi:heat shock protein HtpX